MSNQYNIAPPTNGKIILYTSMGEIEIELWSKEIPNNCRLFIRRCLEGYYNNCIFHRIIPDFIVQTGLASNCSHKSSDKDKNKTEPDEFHSRIKFLHRGIVACAGSNGENDGEFFITLNKAEQLNHKHTILGKVVGDTIYNVLKMSELEVDDDNTPVHPPKVLRAEVVVNPFPDLVVSQLPSSDVNKQGTKQRKKKAVKNVNLLSFGDEIDESVTGGIDSSHDVLEVSKKVSKKKKVPQTTTEVPRAIMTPTASQKVAETDATLQPESSPEQTAPKNIETKPGPSLAPRQVEQPPIIDRFRKTESETKQPTVTEKPGRQSKYLSKKRSRGSKEEDTMEKLSKFARGITDTDNKSDWRSHKLAFDKLNQREANKAEEEYEVYDPTGKT